MTDEIIIIEEKTDGKNSSKLIYKLFEKEKINVLFLVKLFSPIYSVILFLIIRDIVILAYSIISYFIIKLLSNYFTILFIKKILNKKSNGIINSGRFYLTELGYTPTEYNKLVVNILFISIISLFLNIFLFSFFFFDLKENIFNLLLLLIFSIVPFLLLIYFLFLPILKEGDYYSKINKELPIASLLLTAFSASNIHPYSAISTIGKLKEFSGFGRLYRQIEKLRLFLAITPIDAISLFSRMVKSESLKRLLQTLSSINLGSSLYGLLKEYMKESFKIFEKKIEEFIDRFNIILAAQLIVFILIPIASMMTIIFMQGDMLSFLFFSLFLIPTMFFFIFYFLIQSYALSFLRMRIRQDKRIYLFSSCIPISIILVLLGYISPSLAFLGSSIFFMLVYYIINLKQSKKNEALLNELPIIVKDIAEEVKKGNSLYQALDHITERYEHANELLKKISFLKKLGFEMEEIVEKEDIPSFFKQVLTILEECDKIGLDPSTIEEFSDFVNRLTSIRNIFKMRTRFFRFSSYLITSLLGFSLGITIGVLGNLISTLNMIIQNAGMAYTFNILNISIPFSLIAELVSTAGYLNSIYLGFLGGYSEGTTVEGVKNALLCVLICFASIYLTSNLQIFTTK